MGRTKSTPRRVNSLNEHNEWVDRRERQTLGRLDMAVRDANEEEELFVLPGARDAAAVCATTAAVRGKVEGAYSAGDRRSIAWIQDDEEDVVEEENQEEDMDVSDWSGEEKEEDEEEEEEGEVGRRRSRGRHHVPRMRQPSTRNNPPGASKKQREEARRGVTREEAPAPRKRRRLYREGRRMVLPENDDETTDIEVPDDFQAQIRIALPLPPSDTSTRALLLRRQSFYIPEAGSCTGQPLAVTLIPATVFARRTFRVSPAEDMAALILEGDAVELLGVKDTEALAVLQDMCEASPPLAYYEVWKGGRKGAGQVRGMGGGEGFVGIAALLKSKTMESLVFLQGECEFLSAFANQGWGLYLLPLRRHFCLSLRYRGEHHI